MKLVSQRDRLASDRSARTTPGCDIAESLPGPRLHDLRIARYSLAFLTLALASYSVLACLNPIGQEYFSEYFNIEGKSGPEIVETLQGHKDRAYWLGVLRQIEGTKKNRFAGYVPNNHAVALAHLGRVKQAIAILEDTERKRPGEYATAANLGTAYELSGENEKALNWIKEGVRRNKQGHSGTEWLHVKILEAKIQMANEPFQEGSVLDIQFDQRPELTEWHTTDHLGNRRSLTEIEKALAYQLHERLEFVKPPEPIVADLLADLSNVIAVTREAADAEAVFALARSFGTSRPLYTKPGIDSPQPAAVDERWDLGTLALGGAGVILLIIAVGIGWRIVSR